MKYQIVLDIFKVSGLFAVCTLCIVLCWVIYPLRQTAVKVNSNLDEVHLVLDGSNKLIYASRKAVDNINLAAVDERFYFEKQVPVLTGQVTGVLTGVQTLLGSVTQTTQALTSNQNQITSQSVVVLKSANEAVRGIAPLEVQAQQNLLVLQASESSLNALVSDPHLMSTLSHIDSTSAHLDATTGDVQIEVHNITRPRHTLSIFNWFGHLFTKMF